MTKALQPWALRTGEAVSPSYLNRAKAAVLSDLRDLRSRRWAHDSVVIEFNDINELDGSEERARYFQCPWALEVEGIEVYAHGDDNGAGGTIAVTLAFTATGITGWEDVSLEVDTETEEVRAEHARRMSIAADQEVKLSFTATPASGTTWRITRGAVVLKLRGDRYEGSQPAEPPMDFAVRDNVAASMINTFCDAVQTAVAADDDDGNVSFPQILVLGLDNATPTPTTDGRRHLSQCGRKIHSFHGYIVSGTATIGRFELLDEGGTLIAGDNLAGPASVSSTAKTGRVTATDTQPSAPTSATGYRFTFDRAVNTQRMYAAIYSR